MTPLRKRMIEDMQLRGLGLRTQTCYVAAVRRLADHYGRSPDTLSEEEVRAYLIALRDRGVARGTFHHNQHGIQFLYRHTLDREWLLFSKKRFVRHDRSACRSRSRTSKFAACCAG
jgi:integrase/recombinase XerD